MKTAKEIQSDVIALFKGSDLAKSVSGKVYRNGYRPRDSKVEDIIVTFTAGLPGQIESGLVTVNIFYPDIDPYQNGVFVEDGKRGAELEALARDWVESLAGNALGYLFTPNGTIFSLEETELTPPQHFVVIALNYRYHTL